MAQNTMSIEQVSTILNSIVAQAKGGSLSSLATKDFVTVAKIGLETGYDTLGTAINQVLSKTIFSNRPYNRKLQILEADAIQYGNHVRKLNTLDSDWVNDDSLTLSDGSAIDDQIVKKPKVVQSNYYGQNAIERYITVYRDQIETAFSGPDEMARFITMIMQNVSDQIEQAHEESARATLLNMIGAVKTRNVTSSVVHLVTEYKAWAGITSTWNYADPSNFPNFARWVFGRIKTASQMMEHRSYQFHQNPTAASSPVPAGSIARHTPVEDQRLALYAPIFDTIDATVLSVTFNDEYLRRMKYEPIGFWQTPADPTAITVNASYMTTAGAITNASVLLGQTSGGVDYPAVLGILFDKEAAGYTTVKNVTMPAHYNARGLYQNWFYHLRDRYWNDFSENMVLFLLD